MRLGHHTAAAHIEENTRVFGFELDAEDIAQIAAVQARGTPLLDELGDCGDEYRR
jgi:diketogulonate reductase-like aldo/keto reductase